MEYSTFFLPTWVCKTCGRVYVKGLNNICMVCRKNRANKIYVENKTKNKKERRKK